MSTQTAKRWIIVSALIVGGAYWFRRIKEGAVAVTDLSEFFLAWGVVYFGLALLSEAAPGVAGSFAIVVAAGDLLVESPHLIADVQGGLTGALTQAQTQGSQGSQGAQAGAQTGAQSATGTATRGPGHKNQVTHYPGRKNATYGY